MSITDSPPSLLRAPPTLSLVVPCYNEQEVLTETAERLNALLGDLVSQGQISENSDILLVDDGSVDNTWASIEAMAKKKRRFHGLKLTRNFGHQNALLAGIFSARGDVAITIDADLQDPPETITKMIAAYRSGADIVYACRTDRTSDTVFKRLTAEYYYRFLRLMGVKLVHNHADFRLLSKNTIESLKNFGEANLFLRGLIPMLGFSCQTVSYRRERRAAGESKYRLTNMLRLSLDGLTSFSVFPLRLIAFLGLVVSLLAFAASLWAFVAWLIDADLVPGWTSVVLPMYFLGGIQLLSIGILGEYIGKVYLEAKKRPRFIVEKSI